MSTNSTGCSSDDCDEVNARVAISISWREVGSTTDSNEQEQRSSSNSSSAAMELYDLS